MLHAIRWSLDVAGPWHFVPSDPAVIAAIEGSLLRNTKDTDV